jgi:TPR repeat protein
MYANATGVTQDFAAAARWYQQAAERGHVSAQFELGDLYIAGSGVPRDYTIARKGRSERNRDAIGERLSAEQIAQARALAERCIETRYAECD